MYHDMHDWPGRYETSDIVYEDNDGILTRFLIDTGYLDQDIWAGATPEYSIEVKTTTRGCNDRFIMSTNQYKMVRSRLVPNFAMIKKRYLLTLLV
jgi:hypothetical protein